jgi:1-acyl-sn-glycerol-3-phosphate acyltransferase
MIADIFYALLRLVFKAVFYIVFRCRVEGVENIPKTGGVIVAANHASNFDPPFAATFVPRHVYFMAKEELFKVPVFGSAIRCLHAFPVKRGASDRNAIRIALKVLSDGHCLGLFPEGTRSRDGKIRKPEPGLALIAAKAKVPVVPTAVIGTGRIMAHGSFLPRLTVIYGKPLYFAAEAADKAAFQEFSAQIMAEIEKMMANASK